MSNPLASVDVAMNGAPGRHERWQFADVGIWLFAVAIAAFFALVGQEATVVDGAYVPRGNDSFYHARRILDAAVGDRGFYEFDVRLHAPDGSWVAWPWGYDYLLAKATQLALWLVPTLEPLAFIAYVPVFWILVNAALFMAVGKAIGLPRELRVLAMICYALSPLTQMLHSIAMIDHHYVEHTFVLLSVWLGLRWFEQPNDVKRAAALGVALGAAPAFHNGLFILQLVPLLATFVLWLRHAAPSRQALLSIGIALVVTTQLVLLPSEPYRRGMFEFGLLSWFHFYVAMSSALALAFMGWRRFTNANLGSLVLVCLVLAVPLVAQAIVGLQFLSGSISILDTIAEVKSPYALFTELLGPVDTASYYSWLLLLAPLLLVYFGYRVLRERRAVELYFAVAAVFGLALLLDQWRLHYFGFFGLVIGALAILADFGTRRSWHRGKTFAVTFAIVAIAYQPALRGRLFALDVPGGDFGYANTTGAYRELNDRCAEDPGTVLASSSDGAAILFHSECSVIATNFILTDADVQHIAEVQRLMQLTPAEIRTQRPDVKYVLVRALDFTVPDGEDVRLVDSNPIVRELLLRETPPAGYALLKNIVFAASDGSAGQVYARLFKVFPGTPSN